jgi:group I intron endonuclease
MNDINNKKYPGKYIYKITNLVNNKCYIGQAVDYQKRFQDHKSALRNGHHDNYHLQNAWDKYHEDSFEFSVLEYAENYNEREIFYITLYDATNEDYGYNFLKGGENPPLGSHATLTMSDVVKIQTMLIQQKTLNEICNIFTNITRGQINRINNGQAWYNDELQYPLKKNDDDEIGVEIAAKVVYDLLHTSIAQKEIAKKYNISRSCVTNLNNGKVDKYYDNTLVYPLRQPVNRSTIYKDKAIMQDIIFDIKNNVLKLQYIADKYNVQYKIIQKINNGGDLYRMDDETYPLRKNRVR